MERLDENMGINDKIAQLLDEHFKGEKISYDGVVDEETFFSSPYRVMFLLKDVNDDGKISDWKQYMNTIRKEALEHKAGWQNICRWMEVLRRPDAVYTDCQTLNGEYNADALQEHMLEVSIVNIKKAMGVGVNSQDDLEKQLSEAVKTYGNVICKEIDMIEPRLVICGGTFEHVKRLRGNPKTEILPCGAEYFICGNSLYLAFYHPSARAKTNVMFCYAKAAFSEAVAKMKELKII